jgi:hypothetical protein
MCSTVEGRSYFTTDGQSVSMSWYRAPLWDLRPDITSYRNVAVWNLQSCFCEAPSLTRGWVCNLQCNHSIAWIICNYNTSLRTSHEKQWLSDTKLIQLLLSVKNDAVYCENHTEHADTVRTSRETYYVSATEINWLMLVSLTHWQRSTPSWYSFLLRDWVYPRA